MSENNTLINLLNTAIQIMVIKSLLPLIIFIIVLLLIISGITDCTTERNDEMACNVAEEYVLSQLDLPYSAKTRFTYSDINYEKKTRMYIVNGTVNIEYVNGEVEIKRFRSIVKANGNEKRNFEKIRLEFLEKK